MKRILSLVGAITLLFVAVVFALQAPPSFPPLDWAKKAAASKPRMAILLEFGHKDFKATDWSGQAVVSGATVVHREGYRFRDDDKVQPASAKDGDVVISWKAKSRPPVRAPRDNPRSRNWSRSPPSASSCTWRTWTTKRRCRSSSTTASKRSTSTTFGLGSRKPFSMAAPSPGSLPRPSRLQR